MAKTKLDIKNEIKAAVANCLTFDDVINKAAEYIVKNYNLKKKSSGEMVEVVESSTPKKDVAPLDDEFGDGGW